MDRELYSRQEMHHGGVREFYKHAIARVPEDEELPDAEKDRMERMLEKWGVPDVLVTNYSMLEYSLMRPLEHIFWQKTRKWLKKNSDDGGDRKLLMVLDESHLYEGAMGTEVSMLLNRLRGTLGAEEEDIQFILTSASLGPNHEGPAVSNEKLKFVAGLTGFTREDDDDDGWEEVSQKFAMPDGIREILWTDNHDSDLGDVLPEALKKAGRSNSGKKVTGLTDDEKKLITLLWDSKEEVPSGDEISDLTLEGRQQIWYNALHNSPVLCKLYTLLNQPEILLDDVNIKPGPMRLEDLSRNMFGDHPDAGDATDYLLDIIARARLNERTPLLPLRAHLFVRGLPKIRVCMACCRLNTSTAILCSTKVDGEICSGRMFNLLSDRGSGEPYIRVWLPYEGEFLEAPSGSESPHRLHLDLVVETNHRSCWPDPIGNYSIDEGMAKIANKLIGLSAHRTTRDQKYTHLMNCYT